MKKQLLILRPDGIGDFVLFSGYLKYFRHIFPGYYITLACEPSMMPLLECCPWIDEILTLLPLKKQTRRYLMQWLLTVLHFNKIKYDTVLYPCYTRSFFGDFISIGLQSNHKITYDGKDREKGLKGRLMRNHFFDQLIYADSKPKWEWERNRELIEKIGYKGEINGSPEYWICKTDEKNIHNIKVKHKLGLKDYIIISVGAGVPINQWNSLKWKQLIISILGEHRFLRCIFSGSSNEKGEVSAIIDYLPNDVAMRCANLAGEINLREFVLIAKDSLLFIGLDSGAAHLAAMAGANVIVIMGGGQFGRFFPYKNYESIVKPRIVFHPLDCFNCEWNCLYEKPQCLSEISADDVLQEVHKII